MPYKIGFLAKLFHLAPQTIHYYEEMGLIKPKRDSENAYRVYEDDSIQRMGTITKLRNAQFPLKETTSAYDRETTVEGVLFAYQNQKERMLQKIEEDKAVVKKLEEYMNSLEQVVSEDVSEWVIEQDDSYYYLLFDDNYPKEKDIIKASKWYENLFWTDTGAIKINDNYVFSIFAKEELYQKKIMKQDMTKNIPAGLYATTVIRCEKQVDYSTLKRMEEEFFKTHEKFELRDCPFTKTVVVYKQDGIMKMIWKLFLPIQEKN